MTDKGDYKFYGAEVSWFSGKVRPYLKYKGIPYTEILPSQQITKDVIIPRVGWNVMPVIITPDDIAVQDTTDIINFLEERFPASPVYPATPRQKLVGLLFELLGDEWMALPAMHYRWRYNFDWIVGEFGKVGFPELDEQAQRERAQPMVEYFSGSCPILGITEPTIPAIEAWYEELLGQLDQHFQQYQYLLGSRPSIGDYGLMGPLYAHLYRDPASGELMKRIAPNVAAWVERMNDPQVLAGEFLADDEVPETLNPILQRMFAEYFPVIHDTVERLADWLDAHPDEEIPRAIGNHTFTIGGATGERAVFPYAQWMLQHSLFFYQGLNGEDKTTVDDWLHKVGGYEAMQLKLCHTVARENNQLVRSA